MTATIPVDTSADAPVLHRRDERGVHWITLNQPKAFNVLSEEVLADLQRQLDAIAADAGARVLVIGAEGKAFCAGHDLKQMKASPRLDYYQALFAQCSQVMLSILKLPVPVIARVQGLATAAGCQLVAQCDMAVAVDSARFGVNGIDVGLFCSTPSVPLVRNMQPKQAMEMLVTGGFISADEARARGLVNRVVPADGLDAAVDEWVRAILAKPREAIAAGKELFYRQRELGIEAAYQLAGQAMACNMMWDVAQEGVQAFIEKRPPSWRTPGG
ncbi:enoyl-CoA hydratase [Ottowia sp.]|uniref:enoyl-CoA hydratase n=1 Tax=Ottowia sp. TaxID=1898956 RepID=UPI002D0FE390|nr:enoyl-CoA hydratase [Ottowia sp.]HOB67906.1 enoyl-CoA hydratase [Ottowia sp.]HPZ58653.1 enoyl-CoA hydratase [Ottowia sp.]HQD48050.1 enoyl-CoA hydratase [Ottowia sp.]